MAFATTRDAYLLPERVLITFHLYLHAIIVIGHRNLTAVCINGQNKLRR